jgi:hypoxanthine phosphoribosyltransferase
VVAQAPDPAGGGALRLRFHRDVIAERVRRLGAQLARQYRGRPPVLVTVLNGGAVFLADLVRSVPLPVEVDFLAVRPVDRAQGSSSQTVALVKDLEIEIAGRHVVLVEDVVNSGLTLSFLVRVLSARDPASLRACVLIDRPRLRVAHLPLDHVGFPIGPELLVGYGLDLGGWFRSLPDLWEVVDEAAVRADPAGALAALSATPPSGVIDGPPGANVH